MELIVQVSNYEKHGQLVTGVLVHQLKRLDVFLRVELF